MSDPVTIHYEPKLQDARATFASCRAMKRLTHPEVPAALVERFLIEYCAKGVQITEPVESWIRRAGERCLELGFSDTGRALVKHAAHEAGHHHMFIEDTRFLVERWNRRYADKLDAEQLLASSATQGMRDYITLHEDVIASSAPFGQVAIEYEIERLSVDLLPGLMQVFEKKLGREVLAGLSFLTEHAELDVGHTQLNRKMMERLLRAQEQATPLLVSAGQRALLAYARFFDECLDAVAREQHQPLAAE